MPISFSQNATVLVITSAKSTIDGIQGNSGEDDDIKRQRRAPQCLQLGIMPSCLQQGNSSTPRRISFKGGLQRARQQRASRSDRERPAGPTQ